MTDNQRSYPGSAKLLPCPFCGSLASATEYSPDLLFKVECQGCAANMRGFDQCKQDAIDAWNTRTPAQPSLDVVPPVKLIEMVQGIYSEEAPPMWRVQVDKYCADFVTETAANNMRNAILALASSPPVQTPEPVRMDDIVAVIANEWGSHLCYSKCSRSVPPVQKCRCFDIANALAAEYDINAKASTDPAVIAGEVREALIEECAKIAQFGAKDCVDGDTDWHRGFRYAANNTALGIADSIRRLALPQPQGPAAISPAQRQGEA